MITVIDYGAGNVRSVRNALARLGAATRVAASARQLRRPKKVIVPGVGRFGPAMDALRHRGLAGALQRHAREGVPLLGICLGLHTLFEKSEEDAQAPGLGIWKGSVRRLRARRVPHMGWNRLQRVRRSRLLKGTGRSPWAYFAHSYAVAPKEKGIVRATAGYGTRVPAVLEQGCIAGLQFHPEKSSDTGEQVLKNFIEG